MGDISNERSMEDILSSIKRIIAEEGEPGARSLRRPRPAPPLEAGYDSDDEAEDAVLELAEIAEPPTPEAEPESVTHAKMLEERQVDSYPPSASTEREEDVAKSGGDRFLSDRTAAATRESLAALSSLIVRPQSPETATLEGLVREMLRPMLSEWLDANLPDLVEKIVQREIERITQR